MFTGWSATKTRPSARTETVMRSSGAICGWLATGQRHVDPAAHHRRRDHEDEEQHEHDVDERRDVDLAEHRRAVAATAGPGRSSPRCRSAAALAPAAWPT